MLTVGTHGLYVMYADHRRKLTVVFIRIRQLSARIMYQFLS